MKISTQRCWSRLASNRAEKQKFKFNWQERGSLLVCKWTTFCFMYFVMYFFFFVCQFACVCKTVKPKYCQNIISLKWSSHTCSKSLLVGYHRSFSPCQWDESVLKMFDVFTQREREERERAREREREREFTTRSLRATGKRRAGRRPPVPPNRKNNNTAAIIWTLIVCESGLQTQQDACVDFYKDQELGILAEDILGRARGALSGKKVRWSIFLFVQRSWQHPLSP